MTKLPITHGGICVSCDEIDDCPMAEILPDHHEIVKEYDEFYKHIRPDLWDEYSVDEPEIEDGIVTQCSMH